MRRALVLAFCLAASPLLAESEPPVFDPDLGFQLVAPLPNIGRQTVLVRNGGHDFGCDLLERHADTEDFPLVALALSNCVPVLVDEAASAAVAATEADAVEQARLRREQQHKARLAEQDKRVAAFENLEQLVREAILDVYRANRCQLSFADDERDALRFYLLVQNRMSELSGGVWPMLPTAPLDMSRYDQLDGDVTNAVNDVEERLFEEGALVWDDATQSATLVKECGQ